MSDDSERFAGALERVATDPAAEKTFSFERLRRAGTPSYWEDRISLTGQSAEAFETVRSSVDEGEEPIGQWSAATTGARVRKIGRALYASRIWELPREPVYPGQDLIEYRYVTDAGVSALVIAADSPVVFKLAELEGEVREIANELRARHTGAELACRLTLARENEQRVVATVAIENAGDRPGLVPNPLLATGSPDDYFRVEIARPEVEQPGVTGMGMVYAPVSMPTAPRALESPWNDEYLVLAPRSKLELPMRVPFLAPASDRFFVRAVVSRYVDARRIAGMPVLRGRAFSRETDTAGLS